MTKKLRRGGESRSGAAELKCEARTPKKKAQIEAATL